LKGDYDLRSTKRIARTMGGSRKYPYPYHGWHLGIPKGRGAYVDWNSEDMRGSLDWNSEGMGGFSGE